MENLMEIDFNKCSEEQVDLILEKARIQKEKALDRKVAELANSQKIIDVAIAEIKEDNRILKEDNEKLKIGLSEVKDKTDILEFEDTSTLGDIKKQAKSRVAHLLGGRGTPQYSLLYRSCIMGLYENIRTSLSGGKALGKIKTEFGKSAVSMAKAYNLDRKHVKRFIQGLQKENEKGYLNAERSKVLEDTVEWLEERGIV